MSVTVLGVFLAFVAVLLGLTLAALGMRAMDNRLEQQRIQTFVTQKTAGLEERLLAEIQGREFSQALLQRTVGAWLRSVIRFLARFTPPKTIAETNRRLTIAGNPFNLRAGTFYGLRVLLLILAALLGFLISRVDSPMALLLSLLVSLLLLSGPTVWLSARMRARQNDIRRGLPDALDMLSVITAAGLSFDQAMLRLGQTFKNAVGHEFARAVSEMEVGMTRNQALRDLQARVDIPELSSFVAVILQSEQLGMSIADVLHSQAEQMRIYRQFRAKEIAQTLPARMMIPLALFIFPALFAVILGPFLPVLLDLLS